MRRLPALLVLVLLCSQPVFAAKHYLGQFYDGAAKPRAEVAWIFVRPDLRIDQIDHSTVKMVTKTPYQMNEVQAVEVLPGKHIISLSYLKDSVNFLGPYTDRSLRNSEVQFEVRGGETYAINYVVKEKWHGPSLTGQGMHKEGTWNATFTPYSPTVTETQDLGREILECGIDVEGVVQSWEHEKLVLTLTRDNSVREFSVWGSGAWSASGANWKVCKKLHPGSKIRVLYFPSNPGEVIYLTLLE